MYIFDEEIPIFSLVQNLNVSELVGEKYLEVLDSEIAKITNYYRFNINSGDRAIEKLVLFNMSTKFTNEDIHDYFHEEGALMKSEVFDMKTISKIVDTLIDKECYIPLAASLVLPKGFW
jgi:type IV pilus assembly protein PilM